MTKAFKESSNTLGPAVAKEIVKVGTLHRSRRRRIPIKVFQCDAVGWAASKWL